jgi:hypothetical protein
MVIGYSYMPCDRGFCALLNICFKCQLPLGPHWNIVSALELLRSIVDAMDSERSFNIFFISKQCFTRSKKKETVLHCLEKSPD